MRAKAQEVRDWCELEVDGVIIRTYCHDDDLLVHSRKMRVGNLSEISYDPHLGNPFHNIVVPQEKHHSQREGCTKHRWTHQTDFRGKAVPLDVLMRVYEVAELEIDWLLPRRGMCLPTEAWEILRRWAA